MTQYSAGADLRSSVDMVIKPNEVKAIPTGVRIKSFDINKNNLNEIPEIQIRARSSLAFKFKVILANGVGTVDIDYPDEIKVLLLNMGEEEFEITKGMRIGQMVMQNVIRDTSLIKDTVRTGGFGSTSNEHPN